MSDAALSPSRARLLTGFAWASLIANIAIIGTGGAVRLTGSGLGCPTWPACTPGSLVPTEELSWHSAIEFGNRLMTGVLGILALVVLILVWRLRRQRPDLFRLAITVVIGVLAQAVVGGITVLTQLNPAIVGFHYLASIIMVGLTTVFLVRWYEGDTPRSTAVPRSFAVGTHVTTVLLVISLVVGVMTTGVGPHSGDANVQRTGVDAQLLAHLHSWPGYALLIASILLTVWAYRALLRPRLQLLLVVLTLIVQIGFGVYQARNGLPPFAVGVHMVLAAVSTSFMTWSVMRLTQPDDAEPLEVV